MIPAGWTSTKIGSADSTHKVSLVALEYYLNIISTRENETWRIVTQWSLTFVKPLSINNSIWQDLLNIHNIELECVLVR